MMLIFVLHRFTSLRQVSESKRNHGFTLIEVLVAILIGLIVMGMAVAILGATNSTSIRVLTKSEVQRNSRDAMVKIVNAAADAESLETCRVGVDKETQDKIIDPTFKTGQQGIAISDCKETASSGIVLAWAYPNQMCYFKTSKTTAGVISSSPAKIVCLVRGGNGRNQSYSSSGAVSATGGTATQSPHPGMNIANCVNFNKPGSTPHEVYQYECNPGGASSGVASSINWPNSYSAPVAGSISIISDLGANVTEDPEVNLFNYSLKNPALGPNATGVVAGELALKSIVSAEFNLRGKYRTGVGNEVSDYFFNHTILFRGSELAQEERANE